MAEPKASSTVVSLLRSFAPVLAFYAGDWAWGLKAGIVASAVVSIAEVVWAWWRGTGVGALFKVTAAMTLGLGALDLICTSPRFFSWEGVFTNLLFAGYVVYLLLTGPEPLLEEIFRQRPELREEADDLAARARVMLAFVLALSVAKAVVLSWVAWTFAMEEAVGIRTAIGVGSMGILFAAIWFLLEPTLTFVRRYGWLKVPA